MVLRFEQTVIFRLQTSFGAVLWLILHQLLNPSILSDCIQEIIDSAGTIILLFELAKFFLPSLKCFLTILPTLAVIIYLGRREKCQNSFSRRAARKTLISSKASPLQGLSLKRTSISVSHIILRLLFCSVEIFEQYVLQCYLVFFKNI